MWSTGSIDLETDDLLVNYQRMLQTVPKFEPNPYTFTKIVNKKKVTADWTSLNPPNWLLLDHTIAVIWSMFSLSPALPQLSIDDLKWAYEFLKRIKNKSGENPPDVKVCLKEIQDRLINLYASLTSLKEGEPKPKTSGALAGLQDDFDEIAAVFGEKIIEDSTTTYFLANRVESKVSLPPSKNPLSFIQRHSSKEDMITGNGKKDLTYTLSLLGEDSDIYEGTEVTENEEVEKYVMSFLEEEKKKDSLQTKSSMKSLIPMKKKPGVICNLDTPSEGVEKKKTSKRVHCYAEMRSLKFQKSTKVKDPNGEEAAYSNLKAEIQRLTINPNVSRTEVMKFLKEWRSEQVDRLHNELKRLSSIEEFMKTLNQEEVEPDIRMNSQVKIKDPDSTAKCNYSWRSFL